MNKHALKLMSIGDTSYEAFQMVVEWLVKMIDSLQMSSSLGHSSDNGSRRSERVSRMKPITLNMDMSGEDNESKTKDGDKCFSFEEEHDEVDNEDDYIL